MSSIFLIRLGTWVLRYFNVPVTTPETFPKSEDERHKVEHKVAFKCLHFQVMVVGTVIVRVFCAF